jgi:hypothetical protein
LFQQLAVLCEDSPFLEGVEDEDDEEPEED